MSLREQLLVVAAVLVIPSASYAVLRGMPGFKSIGTHRNLHQQAEAKLVGLKWPEEPRRDAEKLRREITTIETAIERQRQELAGLRDRFVADDDAEAQQGLKLKISALAEACGVRIVENRPVSENVERAAPSAPSAPPAQRREDREEDSAAEPFFASLSAAAGPRPRDRIVLQTTFAGLKRFVHGLNRLPSQVLVMEFKVAIDADVDAAGSEPGLDTPTDESKQALRAELVILR